MIVETVTIAFLGVFFGVFLRTWLPAYKKKAAAMKAGETFAFDSKYIATAIASMFISLIICFMIMPTVNITSDYVSTFGEALKVFGSSLISGFGANALVNEFA